MRRIWSNAVLRSVAGVGGAVALSQLAMFLVSPLLARIFSQEEVGVFALLTGLANILAVVALFGLSETIVAPRDDRDAQGLFMAGILSTLVMAVPLAALTYGLMESDSFGYGQLPSWSVPFIVLFVIVISFNLLAQLWLVRARQYRPLATSYLVLGFGRAALQVGFGLAGLGPLGLAAGDLVSRTAALLWMLRSLQTELPAILRTSPREAAEIVWRFRIFPISRTPGALANNIGTALPPVLVALRYDLHTTGLFALMAMVLAAPVGLLQKAVGDVFLGHFSSRFQTSPAAGRRLMFKMAALLVPIGLAAALCLYLFAPAAFAILFGEEWRRAGEFAALMTPLFVMELVVAPLGGVLMVTHRPDAKVYVDLLRIGGFIASYYLARLQEAPAETMVAYFGAFGFLAYLVYAALELYSVYHPREIRQRV